MRSLRRNVVAEVVLGFAILVVVIPMVWMMVLAVQPGNVIVSGGWHLEFTMSNFASLFAPGEPYVAQFLNSIVITTVTVALCLVVGTLAGYSLSSPSWSPKITVLLLGVTAFLPVLPPMALVPGLYSTLQSLGLLGSILGLIMLNTVFNLPFTVLLMRVYFGYVPRDLREAALIDGASEFVTFRKVILPVVAPGLASAGIYTAVTTWNDFLFGLTMTSGGTTAPVTVGVAALVQPDNPQWGVMAAAGTMTVLPVIAVAIFARRRIVSGITQGAVKG